MWLSGMNYCASCTTRTVKGTGVLLRCGFNASKTLPVVRAWQQRHPRGRSDKMIEWLGQCEREAEGIRRSRHTQVSRCGVSLEEAQAERR